jgi:hypothetical protein
MLTALVLLSMWLLINILFVLIVVPPRKPRPPSGTTLLPAQIDKSTGQLDQDEPLSLRHVVISVAMGAFFMLVPPLITLRNELVRIFRRWRGGGV